MVSKEEYTKEEFYKDFIGMQKVICSYSNCYNSNNDFKSINNGI